MLACKKRRPKILIVDRDVEFLCRMVNLFGKYGCEMAVATTDEGAITEAGAFRPDAIYMGLSFPDRSGFELVGELRKLPCLANCMMVALIECDEQIAHSFDHKRGFDHFLPRHVSIGALFNAFTRSDSLQAAQKNLQPGISLS